MFNLQKVDPREIERLKLLIRYLEMRIEEEKVTYIIAKLSEEFHYSESAIFRLVKKYRFLFEL